MPVQARCHIRKMRGGAQAHLIQAADGRYYIVKFRNNPQHRRILVNEWIASALLAYLEIAQPETAIVEITEEFLKDNPDVYIQQGSKRVAVEAGWHFGSCFPGDPNRQAVYDYLPDALLGNVVNLGHFRGVLAFDKWVGNADARQSIFFRARINEWMPGGAAHPFKAGFLAQMVDHGFILNGPHWQFVDSPLQGLYFRTLVYEKVTSWADFQPWLDRVVHFPEEALDEAYRRVPEQWKNGDGEELERLFEQLLRRRKRVPDLIRDVSRGRVNPFPRWA